MPRSKSRPSKPKSRPVKPLKARKRRRAVHEKRLIALGVPEENISKLSTKEVRELLKTPEKTRKAMAAK